MRLLKWLIGIVITVGILLTLTPLVAKWYLVRWLESQGYSAEIKKMSMDFIFGELRLQGVDLQSGRHERLSLLDASVDFNLWALLQGRWVIDKLKVDSARLEFTRSEEGVQVGGFPVRRVSERLSTKEAVQVRSVELTNTDICRGSEQCLRMETLVFSRAAWHRRGDNWSFVHDAPLRIQRVFLRDQVSTATLLFAGELNLGRGSYAPGMIKLENVALSNFQFVESALAGTDGDAPYQTRLGELTLSSFHLVRGDQPQLTLGELDITSLRQTLNRSVENTLVLPPRLRRVLEHPEWETAVVVMESVTMRDGAVSWVDHTVTPPAMVNLAALQLRVEGLDSRLPANPTPLKLSGKVGHNGVIKLEGDLYPFSEAPQFTLSGFVQNLDLTPLSGYGRAYMGQGVIRGQADVSFSAVVRNHRADADTRWQVTDLQLEPGGGSSAHLPVERSFDLLKDHKNSVTFDLPLYGALEGERLTPKHIFGVQLRQVLSDRARRHINPTGAVSIPAGASRSSAVTFEPLTYAVQGHYPVESDRTRLQELAALLRDKPHLQMEFCPVTTGGEWAEIFNNGVLPEMAVEIPPEQHEVLLNLAAARGRALRSHMVEAGATSDQISLCDPRVDMARSGLSFVTISL
jgi:hypothetical protein